MADGRWAMADGPQLCIDEAKAHSKLQPQPLFWSGEVPSQAVRPVARRPSRTNRFLPPPLHLLRRTAQRRLFPWGEGEGKGALLCE